MQYYVCLHVSRICLRALCNLVFKLICLIAYLFAFIENTAS